LFDAQERSRERTNPRLNSFLRLEYSSATNACVFRTFPALYNAQTVDITRGKIPTFKEKWTSGLSSFWYARALLFWNI